MRGGGRMYWRRVRERERIIEQAPLEDRSAEIDYDRDDIMEKIDSLPMGWRMLINEHGFTAVMRAREVSTDIRTVERMMNQRHAMRQRQLAEGHF